MPQEDSSPHADMTIDPKSVVEKLVRERQAKERADAKVIENMEEWKRAVTSMCSTGEGKLFIKYLLRHVKLFKIDDSRDMTKMLEDRGGKNVYLGLIRPYLPQELLAELENQK